MISFIIIGRNEGWKITCCIQSVIETVNSCNLKSYEIIYVDSNSTDDSVERVKQFKNVKIFILSNIFNAAIARNVGFKESRGEVLYFIDGDMEISSKFLPLVYNQTEGLKYNFVSGQLKNFNYDQNGKFINNSWQYSEVIFKDKYYSTTGGIFLIKRKLWLEVGGMDIRFKRGQELELALRLARKGYKILRKSEIIANHHTISYIHHSRMWKTLFSGDTSYSNSFLLRKHYLNSAVYFKIAKQYYTLISFLFLLGASLITRNFFILFIYFFVIGLKTIRAKPSGFIKFVELFLFYIVRDFIFLLYLFVPIKKINTEDISYFLANGNKN